MPKIIWDVIPSIKLITPILGQWIKTKVPKELRLGVRTPIVNSASCVPFSSCSSHALTFKGYVSGK